MHKLFFMAAITSLLLVTSCQSTKPKKPKNVILMIGDGMGPGQVSLLYYYLKYNSNPAMKNVKFAFDGVNSNQIGISNTQPHGNIVVDSACSATQLATGEPARSEMIGLDINGEVKKTILQKAQDKGLMTGLVSDTRLTHATPASFAAHVANRWSEDQIAAGMVESAPDIMFSGGAYRFIPKGMNKEIAPHLTLKSKRKDDRNLLDEARAKGIQVIHSRSELEKIDPSKKVLGLFTNGSMPEAIWYRDIKEDPKREVPTLLEMSKAAINKLSKSEKGFFLMIEGGQIDWAGHQNDAGSMLHEMLSFNETINWVTDWVKKNPDTLLVITADHETGGFGFGYNVGTQNPGVVLNGSRFGGKELKPLINYGAYNSLDTLYSQKKNILNLWVDFLELPKKSQTPAKLCELVKDITSIELKQSKCREILTKATAEDKRREGLSLSKGQLPELHDYHDHYWYDIVNIRIALITHAIADKLNIVWGTGGHTAAPVHVYTLGEREWANEFSGQLTHPEIGKKLQEALNL